jgi:hypothetical protein
MAAITRNYANRTFSPRNGAQQILGGAQFSLKKKPDFPFG